MMSLRGRLLATDVIVWAFLYVLSPPGLPVVRARVLGLLKGELDAHPGRGRGRSVIGLGWIWDGVLLGFLFSVWDVR